MNTTSPSIEAKVAKIIYNNLTPFVVKASIHPILGKFNLHNNRLLKKINIKAKMLYYMSYEPDTLVKSSYERGGEDNIENALLTIQELVRGDYHADHKEYIFKRIEFLVNEAMSALYDRNHQDWLTKIGTAIRTAKNLKAKKITKSDTKKSVKTVIKPLKKTIKRRRNKKGQFIANRRSR